MQDCVSESPALNIMILNIIFHFAMVQHHPLTLHGVGCLEDVWNLRVCVRSECEG